MIEAFDWEFSAADGFADLTHSVSTYDYGNSPLDVQNRFAGFFSYDLPGIDIRPRVLQRLLSGFRLNGIGFWQSGLPFTAVSSVTEVNSLATINLPTITVDKPNQIGPVVRTGSIGSANPFFSVGSFAQQALGTAGGERRNQIFGPHLRRGDLSLVKDIHVREGLKLELRAECFNFTNTPNFAQPNSVITSYNTATATRGIVANGGSVATSNGGFGTITNTAFGFSGRQYQFAGRFSF